MSNLSSGEASWSLQYLINASSNNSLTTSADKYVISLFCSQIWVFLFNDIIIGFVARLTQRVSPVQQKLHNLTEHLCVA